MGHSFDKIEIIVMGGTFTAAEKEYQEEFICGIFKALNDFSELFFLDGEFDFLKFKEFFELPGDMRDKEREANIQRKLLEVKSRNKFSLEKGAEKKRDQQREVRSIVHRDEAGLGFSGAGRGDAPPGMYPSRIRHSVCV